jgi:tagatose 6-phosphate kinase
MILCIGTTPTVQRTMVFEHLTMDAVNRAASVEETASGKSINAARVVLALGERPLASGFLGGDTGQFIRGDLDRAGIEHDFVTVGPKTRICITAIDQAGGTATELIEESKPVEPEAWEALRERVRRLMGRVRAVVMSGTLPPGAPAGFYAECVEMAQRSGVMAIVDAKGEPLLLAARARPVVVKPNRAELGQTVGMPVESDTQLRDAIAHLLEQGPQWVVVTMGKEGSVVSDGRRWWRVDAPEVKAVSPIGSGDAFAGGLAVGLVRGMEVPQACVLGTSSAAANALVPVAGRVRAEDIARLQEQVRIEPF